MPHDHRQLLRAAHRLLVIVVQNVYLSDERHCLLRKVTPDGLIHTVAGGGGIPLSQVDAPCLFGGDGGPARQAYLERGLSVAIGRAGDLIVGGEEHIRRIDAAGIIDTIAGGGADKCLDRGTCCPGDGAPAVGTTLRAPIPISVGTDGSVYFIDGIGPCPKVRVLRPVRQ